MEHPLLRVADVAVAVALMAAGVVLWRRARPTSVLLVSAGATWLLAGWLAPLLFWHRALVAHAILAYPGWRPPSLVSRAVVAIGYVTAVFLPAALLDEWVTIGSGVALAGAAAYDLRGTRGRIRHQRRVEVFAAGLLAAALVLGATARLLAERDLSVPTLLAYELTLVLAALVVSMGMAPPRAPALADVVIDLGKTGQDVLREEIARTLRDPDVRIGYWDVDAKRYVDAAGQPVTSGTDGRVGLEVRRDGRPFALLALEPELARDSQVVASIETATRIRVVNARRQTEVLDQVSEIEASRRRLLLAADDERQRLELELRRGLVGRIEDLRSRIQELAGPARSPHLSRGLEQVTRTLDDLSDVAAGLRPRDLDLGLPVALGRLAAHAPVRVQVVGAPGGLAADVELTLWYLSTEAISNCAKHAPGATLMIGFQQSGDTLRAELVDDGPGGATLQDCGGLRGLADRVESLGGSFTLESDPSGTRLVVGLPLGDRPGRAESVTRP
ncbi:MAG TPA: hypothetical protein VFQ17_00570 [Nocardioides sp.]|nr:hypothetical protein [Nocardioides sp.]